MPVRRPADACVQSVCKPIRLQMNDRVTAMSADPLDRKASHFVLWRPRHMSPPRLVIGELKPGNPPAFVEPRSLALQASPKGSDLWEIPVAACALTDGEVYHYWFEVTEGTP